MYHGFTDKANDPLNYHGKHLHISTFLEQAEHLKKHYNVVPLTQFLQHCKEGTPPPRRSVVLTFDDGYASNYILAYPILKRFKLPASIFLTTDFIEQKNFIWANRVEYSLLTTENTSIEIQIGSKKTLFTLASIEERHNAIQSVKENLRPLGIKEQERITAGLEGSAGRKLTFEQKTTPAIHKPMDWGQVKEMVQCGLVTAGAHTCSHAILSQCSPEELAEEISIPKKLIEQKLNVACELFCYPYGGTGTFNELTTTALKHHGYSCALTTLNGTNHLSTDPFFIKRLGTSNHQTMEQFRNNLLSSHKRLRALRKKMF